VQGGNDAFHPDLFQHGKGNLVFLAKPSPSSFHVCCILCISKNTAKIQLFDDKTKKKPRHFSFGPSFLSCMFHQCWNCRSVENVFCLVFWRKEKKCVPLHVKKNIV
jgi:hypothetical protein